MRIISNVYSRKTVRSESSGISRNEEFNDFLNRCGDEDIEIIHYSDCYIGQLSLPVKK